MNEGKKRRQGPTSEAKAIKSGPPPLATEGLNDLDQERAASVADEGGVTAAALESQATARNETESRSSGVKIRSADRSGPAPQGA